MHPVRLKRQEGDTGSGSLHGGDLSTSGRAASPVEVAQQRQTRAPPQGGASSVEVYGFVGWITSAVAFALYVLWATVPEVQLHQMGMTYYPSKHWALAIPVWLLLGLAYVYWAYEGLNAVAVPPMPALCNIQDGHSKWAPQLGRPSAMGSTDRSIPPLVHVPPPVASQVLHGGLVVQEAEAKELQAAGGTARHCVEASQHARRQQWQRSIRLETPSAVFVATASVSEALGLRSVLQARRPLPIPNLPSTLPTTLKNPPQITLNDIAVSIDLTTGAAPPHAAGDSNDGGSSAAGANTSSTQSSTGRVDVAFNPGNGDHGRVTIKLSDLFPPGETKQGDAAGGRKMLQGLRRLRSGPCQQAASMHGGVNSRQQMLQFGRHASTAAGCWPSGTNQSSPLCGDTLSPPAARLLLQSNSSRPQDTTPTAAALLSADPAAGGRAARPGSATMGGSSPAGGLSGSDSGATAGSQAQIDEMMAGLGQRAPVVTLGQLQVEPQQAASEADTAAAATSRPARGQQEDQSAGLFPGLLSLRMGRRLAAAAGVGSSAGAAAGRPHGPDLSGLPVEYRSSLAAIAPSAASQPRQERGGTVAGSWPHSGGVTLGQLEGAMAGG